MARKRIEWQDVEREYTNGGIELRQLAEKRGISYTYMTKKAAEGDWKRKRQDSEREKKQGSLERVTRELLIRIEETIRDSRELDAKEIKALSSAIKELEEVREQLKGAENKEGIIIKLSQELEELGK